MKNRARKITKILFWAVLIASAILSIIFSLWWLIPIIFIGIIFVARYVSIKYYKDLRDRQDFTTQKGKAIIKDCNKKINEMYGIK